MAKRKSFDEKSKGMHKSRKLIIDTVFGREDTTQRVHGYEGPVEQKKEVGEKWTDSDGKMWEQKEGYAASVSQFDEVREYLQKLSTCSAEDCKTIKLSHADKKVIVKTGFCFECLQKYENKLKLDGVYPFYEDYKVTNNKLAYVRDLRIKYEEALIGIKDSFEMVTEDGRMESWKWDVDINKVREEISSDIQGANEAIKLLIERKSLLEEKFIELNHPELIKK
jgi:hypothetical protein